MGVSGLPAPGNLAVRLLARGLAAALPVALVAGVLTGPSPAAAAVRVTPGDFTGYAFDARCAPGQAEMDVWLTSSPFWGAGVYIGGSTMSCRPTADDPGQPHLDAEWVRRQTGKGWRLLPVWVGPQASCSGYADRIDPTPTDSYAAAGAQGGREAAAAVETARQLGIAAGSTVWFDLEGGFDLGDDDCRRSALRFLSGWTLGLRELGYRSGVYSSVAAGIHALDNADKLSPGSYEMPDQIWYAWHNDRPDTFIDPKWVRADSWSRDRLHQYRLDEATAYGGVTLTIDRSFMDVGRGSVAPRAPRSCGVRIDFADYRTLARGSTGGQVKALQCLLKQRGRYDGRVDGRFDRDVVRAVRSYQRARDLGVTGKVGRRIWVGLLSHGATPVLKRGSADNAVRRLQRTLNVATDADLGVNGVFGGSTTRWLRTYQRQVGLPVTGVAAADTWASLHDGR